MIVMNARNGYAQNEEIGLCKKIHEWSQNRTMENGKTPIQGVISPSTVFIAAYMSNQLSHLSYLSNQLSYLSQNEAEEVFGQTS